MEGDRCVVSRQAAVSESSEGVEEDDSSDALTLTLILTLV